MWLHLIRYIPCDSLFYWRGRHHRLLHSVVLLHTVSRASTYPPCYCNHTIAATWKVLAKAVMLQTRRAHCHWSAFHHPSYHPSLDTSESHFCTYHYHTLLHIVQHTSFTNKQLTFHTMHRRCIPLYSCSNSWDLPLHVTLCQ